AQRRSNVQDFQVLVDGASVGSFTPSGSSYQAYTTAAFAVSAGSHTITFQGLDTAGGDNTAFIDVVALKGVGGTTGAPGFDLIPMTGGQRIVDPVGAGWEFTGNAGLSVTGSGLGTTDPSAHQGGLVAFLQGTGSMNQVVTGWAAGTYALTFDAAQSAGN